MMLNRIIQEIYTHYYLVKTTHSFGQLLFLFFLFSAMGWLLETGYRTIRNRRLINPGFLKGPFIPIYGVSGIFILITYLHAYHYAILTRIVFYFFTISFLEYFTGEVILGLFKRRLWDYRKDILNFRGHVCIPFSLAWAVLSILFEQVIYPFTVGLLLNISTEVIWICNGIALLLVLFDFAFSSGLLANAAKQLRIKPVARPLAQWNGTLIANMANSIRSPHRFHLSALAAKIIRKRNRGQ